MSSKNDQLAVLSMILREKNNFREKIMYILNCFKMSLYRWFFHRHLDTLVSPIMVFKIMNTLQDCISHVIPANI